jgi:hypothetical protein
MKLSDLSPVEQVVYATAFSHDFTEGLLKFPHLLTSDFLTNHAKTHASLVVKRFREAHK